MRGEIQVGMLVAGKDNQNLDLNIKEIRKKHFLHGEWERGEVILTNRKYILRQEQSRNVYMGTLW